MAAAERGSARRPALPQEPQAEPDTVLQFYNQANIIRVSGQIPLYAEFAQIRRTIPIVRRVFSADNSHCTPSLRQTRRTMGIVRQVPIIVPGLPGSKSHCPRVQSGLEPILSPLAFYLALSAD